MSSTALLVVDMQSGMFDPASGFNIDGGGPLRRAVSRLIAMARSAGCAVVYTQHCGPAGSPLAPETGGWEIHPELTPGSGDSIVLKHRSDAFEGTDLAETLRRLGVGGVVICGLQTEHCIAATAISAMALGFEVTVAGDCHGTAASADHSAAEIVARENEALARRGAGVADAAVLATTVFAGDA